MRDDTPDAPPPRANRVPDADDRDDDHPQRDDRDDDYHPRGADAKYDDDGNEITQNDVMWAVFAHIGTFVAGFLAPLIILIAVGKSSPFVARHCKESLNHIISVALYSTLAVLVGVAVGFGVYYSVASQQFLPAYLTGSAVALLVTLPLALLNIVCLVLATVAASKAKVYRYPFTLRLIG